MERYIFLDIDGVLNTNRSYKAYSSEGKPWRDDYGPFFDNESVNNLRHIIETTGADVIITSTWKYKGIDAMHTLWTLREMPGFLLGVTPEVTSNDFCMRSMEIKRWLAQNAPENPDDYRFVIIDDSSIFLPEHLPHLVSTSSSVGITPDDAEKAIAILTQTPLSDQ
ncbi:MAG: hypothetical protein J5641_02975 [Bacteroidales bacterium]|nr:hypothetical protein [Bacteroidales bacterium]